MKKCINCSKQIANNAKKCKYCWELVEKKSIKVKRWQRVNSNGNDIEQLLCPICGWKYKKQWIYWDVFCDKCMNVFFDETRWRNAQSFLDKYISYDDLRRWEWRTASNRSCHSDGFSHCVICNMNNVDKTRDPNGIAYWLLAKRYYYDFFLCRECVARFLAAYNIRLRPWEEYMIPSKSLEDMNSAPFKKFKRIRLEVRLQADNMSFWLKVKGTIKNMEVGEIVWILFVVFWLLVFVICWIMSFFD